jgi:hypothetical protein
MSGLFGAAMRGGDYYMITRVALRIIGEVAGAISGIVQGVIY